MFDENRSSDKITEILTDIKDDNSSNSFDEKSMNNNNLKFILLFCTLPLLLLKEDCVFINTSFEQNTKNRWKDDVRWRNNVISSLLFSLPFFFIRGVDDQSVWTGLGGRGKNWAGSKMENLEAGRTEDKIEREERKRKKGREIRNWIIKSERGMKESWRNVFSNFTTGMERFKNLFLTCLRGCTSISNIWEARNWNWRINKISIGWTLWM